MLSKRRSRGSRRQCGAIWLCLWDLSERNTQRAEKNDSPSNGTEQTTPCGYDIHAFSRPRQMLARLGYPPSRQLRERFAGFRVAYDESRRWQIALGLERARREIASGHAAASDKSNRNQRC